MAIERIPGVIKIPKSRTVQLTDSDTVIFSGTSGRVFHLEAVIVTETRSGVHPTVSLYDGPSTNNVRPIAPIQISDAAATPATVTIGQDVLRGVPQFKSGVIGVSSVSGTWITIIGYEE